MHSVLIRPLEIKDAETSWKWRNDSEVWKYTGSSPDRYIAAEVELDWIKKVLAEPTSKRFAILVDGVYVGNIQLTGISSTDAEYHIFIGDRKFWGKGIAKLASFQLLYYAKNVLKLESIHLKVKSEHSTAISLYKKCGFKEANEENGFLQMHCELSSLSSPKLSVFMMVYNHEKYLEKAIEGVLKQKTKFPFDIVVGEDCSTDDSRKLLTSFVEKYPGKFIPLLHQNNVGAHKNQEMVFNACSGEYMAFCEGDDFWTDPDKLQKQVDFLEDHPLFNICFHPVQIIDETGKEIERTNKDVNEDFTIEDLIQKNFMYTSSVLTRRSSLPRKLPSWFLKASVGDWPMHLIAASTGKIKKLDQLMSIYRVHSGGAWSQRSQLEYYYHGAKRFLTLKKYFHKKYAPAFNRAAAHKSAGLLYGNLNSSSKSRFKMAESVYLFYRTSFFRPLKNLFSPIKLLFAKSVSK